MKLEEFSIDYFNKLIEGLKKYEGQNFLMVVKGEKFVAQWRFTSEGFYFETTDGNEFELEAIDKLFMIVED